uniref:Putative ovule protein n=1 Tax=Solanum chacoense TaxID=4108 RepID=A0A0V0H541_SOLCH
MVPSRHGASGASTTRARVLWNPGNSLNSNNHFNFPFPFLNFHSKWYKSVFLAVNLYLLRDFEKFSESHNPPFH